MQRAAESVLRLKASRHDHTNFGYYSRCWEAKEWTHELFAAFAGGFGGRRSKRGRSASARARILSAYLFAPVLHALLPLLVALSPMQKEQAKERPKYT